jgi:hypothetical protein
VRASSRTTAPAVALIALLVLAGCGGGRTAVYTAPGHAAPPGGPAITLQSAQQAIEDRGADLFQNRLASQSKSLDPQPVDSAHFTTADSGFFDLYIFVDEAAAQAAVPTAKDLSTAQDGRVVQVLNTIAVEPGNGTRSMIAAVRPGLQALAQTAAQEAQSAPDTRLRDQEGPRSEPSTTAP